MLQDYNVKHSKTNIKEEKIVSKEVKSNNGFAIVFAQTCPKGQLLFN